VQGAAVPLRLLRISSAKIDGIKLLLKTMQVEVDDFGISSDPTTAEGNRNVLVVGRLATRELVVLHEC
jgi:hypothetical protein